MPSPPVGAPGQILPRHRHTPLEACVSVVWGQDPFAPELPELAHGSPRTAFEDVLREHLRRSPCLVSFSGGRDSSAVLALAVHVARRDGLPEPVPITNRFPGASLTAEDDWQDTVVRHLRVGDWIRLDWEDELDVLGPYGRRLLLRHGPLFPHNAHFLEPMLEAAAGGALLTGIGGDELLGPEMRPVATSLLHRRRLPSRRALRRLALELAPRRLRAMVGARRMPPDSFDWLRPDVRRLVADGLARADADAPLRWDRSLRWWWRGRFTQCARATITGLGAAHDVSVGAPFSDPAVVGAYARAKGAAGPGGRQDALVDLLGGLLPASILRRSTKASFDEAFWNRETRAFVASWDGGGLDDRLVDPERLRERWNSQAPPTNSYTLLQQAWLAKHHSVA